MSYLRGGRLVLLGGLASLAAGLLLSSCASQGLGLSNSDAGVAMGNGKAPGDAVKALDRGEAQDLVFLLDDQKIQQQVFGDDTGANTGDRLLKVAMKATLLSDLKSQVLSTLQS